MWLFRSISLMTLTAASSVGSPGSAEFIAAALVLALLSGVFLLLMGVLKLGFLANLQSHPVVSGFITASGIIIATSQLKAIFGISASGERSEEHTSELQSIMRISYAVFCLKKKNKSQQQKANNTKS